MNLIACLAYYAEDPEWLDRAVRSLAILGVTHLVAADGAYSAYPDASAVGSRAERDAIRFAAETEGIEATVYVPDSPWPTEMHKRSFLFQRSETLGADWHLVFDADYFVAEGFDLKPVLQDFDSDVGEILLRHHVLHGSALTNTMMPMPMLFRAIPGLSVIGHHANYQLPDGRQLWGDHAERATRIEGVTVDHLSAFRDPKRLEDQMTYYERRRELKLERHPERV